MASRDGRHEETPARFDGIERPYTEADVERLRWTVQIEHTLAARGAERLWPLRINRALQRADLIHHAEGNDDVDWFCRSWPTRRPDWGAISTSSSSRAR